MGFTKNHGDFSDSSIDFRGWFKKGSAKSLQEEYSKWFNSINSLSQQFNADYPSKSPCLAWTAPWNGPSLVVHKRTNIFCCCWLVSIYPPVSSNMASWKIDYLEVIFLLLENKLSRGDLEVMFLLNPQWIEWMSQLATFDDTGGYRKRRLSDESIKLRVQGWRWLDGMIFVQTHMTLVLITVQVGF